MTNVVSAAELREDELAEAETNGLIKRLTRKQIDLYAKIAEIETLMAKVESPERLEQARMRVTMLRWDLFETVSEASGGAYTPEEVESWVRFTVGNGADIPNLGPRIIHALVRLKKVPTMHLREAVIEHVDEVAISWTAFARSAHAALVRLETTFGGDYGSAVWDVDSGKSSQARERAIEAIKYHLGLHTRVNARERSRPILISYERAAAIAEAVGMTPQQAGV